MPLQPVPCQKLEPRQTCKSSHYGPVFCYIIRRSPARGMQVALSGIRCNTWNPKINAWCYRRWLTKDFGSCVAVLKVWRRRKAVVEFTKCYPSFPAKSSAESPKSFEFQKTPRRTLTSVRILFYIPCDPVTTDIELTDQKFCSLFREK